jgi:BirA family transcriptional regulator, biotin operon repressor / biotin---[acetyl-CoA-carboxylase] ligase
VSVAEGMTEEPRFPPPFEPVSIAAGSAFDIARSKAAAGAGAGTLVWLRRADRLANRFDWAVVLEPSEPLEPSLTVAYVALLGLGDALAALGPPHVRVSFGWPDRVAVNRGRVGGIRIAAAETGVAPAIPDWLVLGAEIRLYNDPDDRDPGLHPDETALIEEGFGEIEAPLLAESLSRNFLLWMNRWQDDGLAPVLREWQAHFDDGQGGDLTVEVAGEKLTGGFTGIDATGALLLGQSGNVRRISLVDALRRPSWYP